MRIRSGIVFLMGICITSTTWARQMLPQLAPEAPDSGVTETTVDEITLGFLRDEIFGVKSMLGIMVFDDAQGESANRLILGMLAELNLFTLFQGKTTTPWYLGPSTGLLFSHLGAPQSNFFGTDSPVMEGAGSNFISIPINLKAGYAITRDLRFSLSGGGNIIYRSVANSIQLSPETSTGTDDDWSIFPNLGADFEVRVGTGVAVMGRGNFTFSSGNQIFAATLGLSVTLR